MIPYIVFYVLSFSFLFLSSILYKDLKFLFIFVFILMILFAGLRGDVGSDTYSYKVIFDSITDNTVSYKLERYDIEPVFSILLSLIKKYTGSYSIFIFSISVLQSSLLWFLVKKIKYKVAFLVIYLFVFYLNFQFNVLRVGLALLVFLVSLSSSNKSVRYIAFVSSVSLHFSIMLFFPLFLINESRGKKYELIFGLLFIAFFGSLCFYFYGGYLLDKIEGYGLLSLDYTGISLVAIFFVMFGVFVLILDYNKDVVVNVSLIVFLVIYFISPMNNIMYRFLYMSLFVYLFLFFSRETLGVDVNSIFKILFVAAIVSWVAMGFWSAVYFDAYGNNYSYIPYNIIKRSELY